MNDSVDVIRLVKDLPARARGRACVVLTHDYAGQKAWAAKLAALTGSKHLDLLDHFAQDADLAATIATVSVDKLFTYLAGQGSTPVLIVSGIEFLTATWAGQPSAVDQFANRLETWNQTPCLLFVMQYTKALAGRQFRRYRQYTFVVDQADTLQL